MFTGLIEEKGNVARLMDHAGGVRITIKASTVMSDLADGASVAVNGVCLTALDITETSFTADVSPETLGRTTIGRLRTGSAVNLERSVTPTTRMGGHIVQGHVDGRGRFRSAAPHGDFWTVAIDFPDELSRYLVHKGSVAVEGISLTIADLYDDFFEIALIPKTWEMTNLSDLNAGDEVNLEVDVIAKYVERMMSARNPQ